MLAGEAALRVGAGRLGMLGPEPIQIALASALPEAAVFALPSTGGAAIDPAVADELQAADAVLVGPGFDDPAETKRTLLTIADTQIRTLVLDAFAIGILPDVDRRLLPARLILNVNKEEAAILLGRELGSPHPPEVAAIAEKYDAVVHCYGVVATPSGNTWHIRAGGPGLGTSGSGDVLAGAITGFAARGLALERAAVWGGWVHARAGDRLTRRSGIGFLARDIPTELTHSINEVLG
jgi:NAD(P)H-hydrate repair Nnr-like enzyme with NAD(P)H-hydrate dehydratase domain